MRKFVMLVVFLLGGAFLGNALASEPGNIPLQIIDQNSVGGGSTNAPRKPLIISLEDFTLAIPAMEVGYTLEIIDNGVEVWSTYVPAGTTQVELPSTLSGEYEIRLVFSTYYYKGYIEL